MDTDPLPNLGNADLHRKPQLVAETRSNPQETADCCLSPRVCQRKRDDNKNKICTFQGGVGRGAGRKIVQNAIFHGKRHDNKILKVKILLSRNFVVMLQAPSLSP